MAISETVAPASTEAPFRTSLRDTAVIAGVLGLLKFALHLYVNGRYGYFRDELYYIACSQHLDWGYVDQPPMIAVMVRLGHYLFGDSLLGVRMFAALSGVVVVMLTVLIARELGGGKMAMWLAGICVLVGPIWLSLSYLMTMNAFEHVIWTACAYVMVKYINTRNERLWLWFGILCGLGLQTKYSITVFGLGVVIGLLLTRERRLFLSKWLWIAGAAALLIFLPNLIWNVQHGWPFVELMRNIRADGRDVVLGPVQFVLQQILLTGPMSAFVWLSGATWLLFTREGGRYRIVGWTILTVVVAFMLLHGKNYYSTPIYPAMFAAGAVALESWLRTPALRWAIWGYAFLVVAVGMMFLPMSVPVLPVDMYLKYQDKMPIKPPRSEHSHERAALPQIYADQFGWTEITEGAAAAFKMLSPEEQKTCGIFAQDYGSAGAIDSFGPRYGLPKVLSGHQSYYLWGPRGYTGECLIVLDDRQETLEREFEQVQFVGRTAPNPYALEQQLTVFIVHKPKFGSLEKVWPQLKKWR
jgi:hypothetical protein